MRIACVLIALGLLSCKGEEPKPTPSPPTPPSASPTTTSTAAASSLAAEEKEDLAKMVEIAEVLSEYKDNELRGDGKFKGSRIVTSGIVLDVGKDLLDEPYVKLGTGKGRLEIPALQCFLRADQLEAASKLSKGKPATVVGIVDGLMMNVLVKDCVVNPTGQVCSRLSEKVKGEPCDANPKTGDQDSLVIRIDEKKKYSVGAVVHCNNGVSTASKFKLLVETVIAKNPEDHVAVSYKAKCFAKVFASDDVVPGDVKAQLDEFFSSF